QNCFFFSSRRRHTRSYGDWSSDVCSSDLGVSEIGTCRFEEPECGINRVVFRSFAGVRKTVGQHALVHVFRKSAQNATRDVMLARDRKSTRLNSSHRTISYAVFCLKKKNIL